MFHHVARAREGQLLFSTWAEGLILWRRVLAAVPDPVALCVMPNHVHLLTAARARRQLGIGLAAYAQGWNARYGSSGPLFERSPAAAEVEPAKVRRVQRYVVLNPCRAGLCEHPLDWPLSTFLDAIGLADGAVRGKVDDVFGHHAYVGADDRVARREMPVFGGSAPSVEALVRAVSTVTRTPLWEVTARAGRARTLAIRAGRQLQGWGVREAARQLGVARSAVGRVELFADPGVDLVARVASYGPNVGLDDVDLRRRIARSRYGRLRTPER